MVRLLCVCTGNTCRSPMLAALFADALRRTGVDAEVVSAGTGAISGEPASIEAVAAMARRGLDLSMHRSQSLEHLDLSGFERIFTVSSRHAAFVRSQGVPAERIAVIAAEQGGVPDPYGGDAAVYEETARLLENEVARLAGALSGGG